jgi:hypothetical protein
LKLLASFSFLVYHILLKFCLENFWGDINNRKSFFDSYAKKNNFDPLIPENWYMKTPKDFEDEKVSKTTTTKFTDTFIDVIS